MNKEGIVGKIWSFLVAHKKAVIGVWAVAAILYAIFSGGNEAEYLGIDESEGFDDSAVTAGYGSQVVSEKPKEDKKSNTVKIGNQIWMKQNLDVEPTTGESWCYGGEADNCKKYGRLYDWAAAMKLPSKCSKANDHPGEKNYDPECKLNKPAHQGICPDGYAIPDAEDWNTLLNYVRTESKNADGWKAKLKTSSGWNLDVVAFGQRAKAAEGTDDYGFSALPGGCYSDFDFNAIGFDAMWWANSANEYKSERIFRLSALQSYSCEGASVRCLKDDKYRPSVAIKAPANPNETVVIGGQTWMKYNLNVKPKEGKSWCYDDNPKNCEILGRLYDWATAMALPDACRVGSYVTVGEDNSITCRGSAIKPNPDAEKCKNRCKINTPNHQGICPEGFHIPSEDDFNKLFMTAGGKSNALKKLKSTSGWDKNGNGTDDYGFSALPGGKISYTRDGYYGGLYYSHSDVGVGGYWWLNKPEGQNTYNPGYMFIYPGYGPFGNMGFQNGASIRCIKD